MPLLSHIFALWALLMADPFSWTAFFTALAATAAASAVTMLSAQLFAPKRKPLIRGKLSGDLYVQNAEPGAVIKTFYGGDLGDGKGFGVLTAGEVLWMSKIRKVTTTTRQSTGGKGFGGGGGSQEVQEINYYVDLAVMAGWGPLDFFEVRANSEVIYSIEPELAGAIFEAENGTLSGPAFPVADPAASNGQAVSVSALPFGNYGSIEWPILLSLGGDFVIRVFYSTSGPDTMKWQLDGGAQNTINLPATGGDGTYGHFDIALSIPAGSHTFKLLGTGETTRVDYIRTIPQNTLGTGMLDVTVPRDPDYTQDTLPSGNVPYTRNVDRWNELPPPDEFGVRGGVIRAGNYAGLVFYPGNTTQEPDPTIQAAVDAEHGEGSTPAYRRRAYAMLNNFSVTKFGGVIPLFLFRVAHQTVRTMEQAMRAECEASGVEPGDIDFSNWAQHKLRGVFVTSIQSARQLHDTLSRRFNTRIVEDEGKLIGVTLGQTGDPVVIAEDDLGVMIDGEKVSEENNPHRKVDVTYASSLEVARTTNLTYYDPGKKYERNTVSYDLIDVDSVRVEQVEVPMTLTSDEAQQMVVREAVRGMLESSEGYTLPVPYKYRPLLRPTKTAVVTEDGATYTMRLTSLTSAPGHPMELVALPEEVSVYVQTLAGTGFTGDVPAVAIAAMTVGVLYDVVLLFDRDETVNNGLGFYAAGRKRTGPGVWNSWTLWRFRQQWERMATSNVPATIGVAASVLAVGPLLLFDNINFVDVDLNDDDALESADEAALRDGANVGLLGDEVIQWLNAERRPTNEGPNRWRLSGLLRGRRGTEHAVDDHVLGERFLLVNEAVVFVPISLASLNQANDFAFVTDNQAVTDAARQLWAWTGGTKRPAMPLVSGVRVASTGDWLVRLSPRSRLGGTLIEHGGTPAGERQDSFYVELLNAARTQALRSYTATTVRVGGERVVLHRAYFAGAGVTLPDDPLATVIHGNNVYNHYQGPGWTAEESTAKAYADVGVSGTQDISFSFTIKLPQGGDAATVGLYRQDQAAMDAGQEFAFSVSAGSSGVTIYHRNVAVITVLLAYGSADRWHMKVINGRVELYHSFDDFPFYTLPKDITFPCVAMFQPQFKARVENIYVGGQERLETVIPAADQVELLGGAQTTLQINAFQWSEYVGRGYEAEVTLTA